MTQLDLIAAPPLKPRFPTEPILREAEITVEGGHKMRWTLRRGWGPGPSILWCGLNPSAADGKRDDPTMLREMGFSYRWGYGSLVKVNIDPFCSSKPAELRRWQRAGKTGNAWCTNIDIIRAEIAKGHTLVAAWGAGADLDRVRDFMASLFWDAPVLPVWKCLGLTADGSPKHTLARGVHRIPDDAQLIDWPYEIAEDYH